MYKGELMYSLVCVRSYCCTACLWGESLFSLVFCCLCKRKESQYVCTLSHLGEGKLTVILCRPALADRRGVTTLFCLYEAKLLSGLCEVELLSHLVCLKEG